MEPSNKLNIEKVRHEFSAAGCTLLEDEYKDNKEPMRFTCHCGRIGIKSLTKFRGSKSCKACGYAETGKKNGRLDLSDVAEVFREKGYTLLASKYRNNAERLPYICKCGSTYTMSLAGVRSGRECPVCIGKIPWNFGKVESYFESQGCKLLSGGYRGMNVAMPYICSCGAASNTTFANFYHKGIRCMACGTKKLSGINAHQYKMSKTDEERTVQRKFPEYEIWRKAVFERDIYTCKRCGIKGTTLHAHHLDNYADHKELQTVVSNGVTLCKRCHQEFHSIYGQKNVTTKANFTEFMDCKSTEYE